VLSVPVQLIVWKDRPRNVSRGTLGTCSLTHYDLVSRPCPCSPMVKPLVRHVQ